MQGALLHIRGRWGQFRKPETNNTPLTHDFITKTALLGLIGAVLGMERPEMRAMYPILCDDLLYGVQVRGFVKKVSWAFTLRNVHAPNNPAEKGPRQMEFVYNPDYTVLLALRGHRSIGIYENFVTAIMREEACFTPVLGLHNCPAELELIGETQLEPADCEYRTLGFAPRTHRLLDVANLRLGFERIPAYQDDNWWNPPERYHEVVYPSGGNDVALAGAHYVSEEGRAWCLI